MISDFVHAARNVFALELQDHSLSTSAVQFAIQDVSAAATAAENNAFEKVCCHSINILIIIIIIIILFYYYYYNCYL